MVSRFFGQAQPWTEPAWRPDADLHALADELDRLGKLADQVETQPGPLDEDWNERRKDEGRAAPQNDRREVAHGSGEAPGAPDKVYFTPLPLRLAA